MTKEQQYNFLEGNLKHTINLQYMVFKTLFYRLNWQGAGGIIAVLPISGSREVISSTFTYTITLRRISSETNNIILLSNTYTSPVSVKIIDKSIGDRKCTIEISSFSLEQELNINDVLNSDLNNTITIELSDIKLNLSLLYSYGSGKVDLVITPTQSQIFNTGNSWYESFNSGYHLYKNLSTIKVNYSSEIIQKITGEGEIQYIAMEI